MGEQNRLNEVMFSVAAGMSQGAKAAFWAAATYLVFQCGRLIEGVVNGSIMVVL